MDMHLEQLPGNWTKAVYRQYGDAGFKTRVQRSAAEAHLGLQGECAALWRGWGHLQGTAWSLQTILTLWLAAAYPLVLPPPHALPQAPCCVAMWATPFVWCS